MRRLRFAVLQVNCSHRKIGKREENIISHMLLVMARLQLPRVNSNRRILLPILQSMLSTPTAVIVLDNIFAQKTPSTSTWSLESGDKAPWQAVYLIQVRTGGVKSTSAPAIISATTTSGSASPAATQTSPPTFSGSNQSVLSPGGVIGLSVSIGCSVITMLFGIGWKAWKYWKEKKEKERERQAGVGASGVLARNIKHLGNG